MSGKSFAVHRAFPWATNRETTLAVYLAHNVTCLYLKNGPVNNFLLKKTTTAQT